MRTLECAIGLVVGRGRTTRLVTVVTVTVLRTAVVVQIILDEPVAEVAKKCLLFLAPLTRPPRIRNATIIETAFTAVAFARHTSTTNGLPLSLRAVRFRYRFFASR